MYLVGLTGGIAAGKSTVAKVWGELGAICIDADDLAREIVEPGQPALKKIEEFFGSEIISAGRLDRNALAKRVFANEQERKALEEITHPAIAELARLRISECPEDAIVVYVIPLLAETKSQLAFDKVVTVEALPAQQILRLINFRGMSESEAKLRVDSQATAAQRAMVSDVVLNANQEIDSLISDAKLLWKKIELEAAS